MIDSKDISVVVQGAIDPKYTKKCLKSIRKHLPKAEIILSTWEGSIVDGLDYDILVENEDPGAIIQDFECNIYNNVNRQLISSQNGLKKVSRKYTLKLRTDFYLKGNRFLKYFDKFPVRNDKYAFFKHRVIVSSLYSREFSAERKKIKTPFHPSDFYFFGLTEDVKSYFENIPIMKKEDMANYHYLYKERKPFLACTFRYSPEQYFCINYVWQHYPDIKFDDWTDWNDENIEFSKQFLYNNFIFLGLRESQIYSNKHRLALIYEWRGIRGLIFYQRFIKRYKRYCDKNYKHKLDINPSYLYDCFKYDLFIWINNTRYLFYNIFRTFYYEFC